MGTMHHSVVISDHCDVVYIRKMVGTLFCMDIDVEGSHL
jgi:hypothetical protein